MRRTRVLALLAVFFLMAGCLGRTTPGAGTAISASVTIRVVEDDESGPSLPGKDVTVEGVTKTTDHQGHAFFSELMPGVATIEVNGGQEHDDRDVQVQLDSGDNGVVTVALNPADIALGENELLVGVGFVTADPGAMYTLGVTVSDGAQAPQSAHPLSLAPARADTPLTGHYALMEQLREEARALRAGRLFRQGVAPQSHAPREVGDIEAFWVEGPSGTNPIEAKMVHKSPVAYTYVQTDLPSGAKELAIEGAQEFAARIYGAITGLFGELMPIEKRVEIRGEDEPRVFIVYASLSEDILGYYWIMDEYSPDDQVPDINGKSMFVMNATALLAIDDPEVRDRTHFATLAHEFTHLVEGHRWITEDAEGYPGWLAEGLGMLAEDIAGYAGDGPLYAELFLENPTAFTLRSDVPSAEQYGMAYLFVRYLFDRDESIIRRIINEPPLQYSGVLAIEGAIDGADVPSHWHDFSNVFADWALALYLHPNRSTFGPIEPYTFDEAVRFNPPAVTQLTLNRPVTFDGVQSWSPALFVVGNASGKVLSVDVTEDGGASHASRYTTVSPTN